MVATALSLLAIKIDIVLEINIHSSFQPTEEKAPATSKLFQNFTNENTFHFKISWQATLQFKESTKKKRENICVAVEK